MKRFWKVIRKCIAIILIIVAIVGLVTAIMIAAFGAAFAASTYAAMGLTTIAAGVEVASVSGLVAASALAFIGSYMADKKIATKVVEKASAATSTVIRGAADALGSVAEGVIDITGRGVSRLGKYLLPLGLGFLGFITVKEVLNGSQK